MSLLDTSTLVASPTTSIVSVSIGKKVLMAVSGAVWVGYLIGHMLGNLQIFLGPDKINSYAHALKELGAILWLVRGFVGLALAVHIWTGISVWIENKKARPVAYSCSGNVQTGVSSRTMIYSGAGLLLFVIYHLLHFTLHTTNPEYAQLPLDNGRFDVFRMMILGFSNPMISGLYAMGILGLAFHINHALMSMFQTLGLTSQNWIPRLKMLAAALALVLFFGFLSIPAAVLAGCSQLSLGGM
ncbi:MAG: succinate dehydrogenase cytochrome b subunit [Candidatus Zixiibacteriota bacterium]